MPQDRHPEKVLTSPPAGRTRFAACTKGTTAIEYALIAAGIALTLAAIVFGIGRDVYVNMFQRIVDIFAGF